MILFRFRNNDNIYMNNINDNNNINYFNDNNVNNIILYHF
jgi:hypothetical protein